MVQTSSLAKNSVSLMMGIPSFSAFSRLDGPIPSPARIKEVFFDMLVAFLPPLSSIIFLYSSRECCSNVPLITIVMPASRVDAISFSSMHICTPASLNRLIKVMLRSSRKMYERLMLSPRPHRRMQAGRRYLPQTELPLI